MSFSLDTKKELCGRKRESSPCCRDALLHGLLLGSREYSERLFFSSESEAAVRLMYSLLKAKYGFTPTVSKTSIAGRRIHTLECEKSDTELIHADFDLFENPYRINESIIYCCDKCSASFLKGLFLARGTVAAPSAACRLEIPVKAPELAGDIEALLSMISLPPSSSLRRGKPLLLYKKSSDVENFLGFIGADGAVLEIMNEKLVKELRNDTNRRSNLEMSGLNRSVSAAVKQAEYIKILEDKSLISTLPDALRQTAELRLKYPDISLAELAARHEPPITKSGVNHRLEKLKEFTDKIKNK